MNWVTESSWRFYGENGRYWPMMLRFLNPIDSSCLWFFLWEYTVEQVQTIWWEGCQMSIRTANVPIHLLWIFHASPISSSLRAPSLFWLSIKRNEYKYHKTESSKNNLISTDSHSFIQSHLQRKHSPCIDNWSSWQWLWSFLCQLLWCEATTANGKMMRKNFCADWSTPLIQRILSASVRRFLNYDITAETMNVLRGSLRSQNQRIAMICCSRIAMAYSCWWHFS